MRDRTGSRRLGPPECRATRTRSDSCRRLEPHVFGVTVSSSMCTSRRIMSLLVAGPCTRGQHAHSSWQAGENFLERIYDGAPEASALTYFTLPNREKAPIECRDFLRPSQVSRDSLLTSWPRLWLRHRRWLSSPT